MPQPKDKDWPNGYKNKTPLYAAYKRPPLKTRDAYRLKVKGWKKIFHANRDQKKAGVAILTFDKTDFIFGGSKITADGDCSQEIKRCLLLRRKVMTNIDSILKSRDIPLPTNVCLVKAMVFPVVMYGYESWTVKKAEC